MAIIGKIRKRGGLIVIVIGIALAIFVFQSFDPLNFKGKKLSADEFAKIAGEKISKQEFDAKVNEQEENYKSQTKKENLTPAENFQMMTTAWDQMERSVIMLKEYEELGIALDQGIDSKPSISLKELDDLVEGTFLHPYIVQSFSDPKTGQVNRQAIRGFLAKFDEQKEDDKKQWKRLEDAIKEERINSKYENLIAKAYYMPKAFAKRMYEESNTTVNARLVGVKYQTISDSTVTLVDDDYNKYYEEHKQEYQIDPSCDIDYVVWEVLPSADDKKKIDEQVAAYYKDFLTADLSTIEAFVNTRSDDRYDSTFMKKGKLPVQMDSIMLNSPVGTTVAPYVDNGKYYIGRSVQIQMRPDSMKASHILVMYKDAPGAQQQQTNVTRTKEQAKVLIDSIYGVLKKDPKLFTALALQKSEFPSAKQDTGNLKWFADGDINFKFFYDSCMKMKVGELRVIQSNLGYHVLYLTGKQEPVKKVKVAIITREIKPSTQTYNSYFAQASEFAGVSRTKDEFNTNVTAKGLNKRNAQFVRKMDYTLPGLETSREIIRWAFNEETEKGSVSPSVFDLQGKYVVALLVDRREKGIAALEQVKTYIEPLVKRDKKAETIIKNVNSALAGTKDLYALSAKFNTKVDTVTALSFTSGNLPNYGPEPEVVGTIFTEKANVLSVPLKGTMAVYVVQVDGIQPAPPATDFSMMQQQLMGMFRQRAQNDVFRAIKDKAEIFDNRILYY